MNQPGTNYFAPYNEDIKFALTNEAGLGILVSCIGNPNVVAVLPDLFATGCELIREDITTGDNVYRMTGSTASPAWTLSRNFKRTRKLLMLKFSNIL